MNKKARAKAHELAETAKDLASETKTALANTAQSLKAEVDAAAKKLKDTVEHAKH